MRWALCKTKTYGMSQPRFYAKDNLMNYRHIYHAGNFADVFKHIVLMLLLGHLLKKDRPFFVLDTHAGLGLYDLSAAQAQKTSESAAGIGRLWETENLPGAVAHYVAAVRRYNPDGVLRFYPGSPLIAHDVMRLSDRLAANELHPGDGEVLKNSLKIFRNVRVEAMDAYRALKSFLPPPEKRGLALVDPPFEAPDEFVRLTQGLKEAHARWATGIYALWYPIKDPAQIAGWHRDLGASGITRITAFDFYLHHPVKDRGKLNGCGLAVVNPPWTLADELRTIMPFLTAVLTEGRGRFDVNEISGET